MAHTGVFRKHNSYYDVDTCIVVVFSRNNGMNESFLLVLSRHLSTCSNFVSREISNRCTHTRRSPSYVRQCPLFHRIAVCPPGRYNYGTCFRADTSSPCHRCRKETEVRSAKEQEEASKAELAVGWEMEQEEECSIHISRRQPRDRFAPWGLHGFHCMHRRNGEGQPPCWFRQT
jgi:hypothetical protein